MSFLRKSVYDLGLAVYFSIYHPFKYPQFLKEYYFIKKWQFKSLEDNLSIQKERLYRIIDFATKNVPFYRKICEQKSMIISKDSIFEDIKKFPILTKDIIRRNWNSLHPDLINKRYIYITSGGTTGEPINLIHDEDFIVKTSAALQSFHEIANYFIGDKIVRLWGDEKLILNETQNYFNYFKNKYLKSTHLQNAFKMSDEIIKRYINELNLFNPKVIYTYVQSIYEIAKYIIRNNIKIAPINSIITTAGVLNDDMKEFIENVFNCSVYNLYGSREVSLIGISCKNSNKIHINMYQKYVEIVDKNFKTLNEHEKGEIIITNLINYSMPLIRYKIGDMGALNYNQCVCGRGLIRLENVYGRTVDIFKNEKSELIDGEFFTHLFYFLDNVKKFQIVQEKINLININIVTLNKNRLEQSIEEELINKIKKVMGLNCEVIFNYVNDIESSPSGKLRYTISKIS